MKFFADTIEPVLRSGPDELFLVRFLAKPSEENQREQECGGAYVNCWVDAEDLRTAEERAIRKLRDELWRPVRLEHWEIVCSGCYSNSLQEDGTSRDGLLAQVAEAFEHGIAMMFHCWPVDAPDANDE